jgi:hypothetical protein
MISIVKNAPGRKTFPIAPLIPVMRKAFPYLNDPGGCRKDVADTAAHVFEHVLGIYERTYDRWVQTGVIREDYADLVACRLGLHPYLIWGELWFEGYEGCEDYEPYREEVEYDRAAC